MRWQPVGHVLTGPFIVEPDGPPGEPAVRHEFDGSEHAVDRSSEAYRSWWNQGMPPTDDTGQHPARGGVQAPPIDLKQQAEDNE